MEETFDPIARTRANYYTPGSPVQFVCVELLKGSASGDRAVCLTFKNISRVELTALDIRFKCKSTGGEIICEDEFEYRGLAVKPGELFGMDDAVFVTQKPITSVDVVLERVYNGKRAVQLGKIKRVRLPAPRRLPDELAAALQQRIGRSDMKYAPQVLDCGWYCACGAFHPKEEDTVYCSECGCDRILLQNALNTLLQPEPEPEAAPAQPLPAADTPPAPPAANSDDGTRAFEPDLPQRMAAQPAEDEGQTRLFAQGEREGTRAFEPARRQPEARPVPEEQPDGGAGEQTRLFTQPTPEAARRPAEPEAEPEATRAVRPAAAKQAEAVRRIYPRAEDEEYEDEDEDRDPVAENIIRWVPPLTALICAGIALYGFVYYQIFL